jgi:hypothetical protein
VYREPVRKTKECVKVERLQKRVSRTEIWEVKNGRRDEEDSPEI